MSFKLPSNVPSFSSQREYEDGYWRATRTNVDNHGFSFASFMNPNSNSNLPMYKDKPHYASRQVRRRRKITWVLAGLVFLGIVWVLVHMTAPGQVVRMKTTKHGGNLWKWMRALEKEKGGFEGDERDGKGVVDWAARREKVRDAFIISWDDYASHAWGHDIYKPLSKKGEDMVKGGLGWIIVDSLDTLMIMNLTSRVQNARNWIHTSLRYDQDHPVNTFETTIRMLGGLLSAHYLSTTYPNLSPIADDDDGAPGEDLYIEKATGLADRLLGAFESPSGVPYASINLNTSVGVESHMDFGASSTAEATTLQLEFKYLAKLTGEANYWEKVEKVMEVVEANGMEGGLVPIFIEPSSGKFMGQNIRLGSRGDSYYEYLIKQYLQTSREEPIYLDMWNEALMGIREHLVTYTKHASLTVIGERPNGLKHELVPKMDHLVCFMPGTISLAATGGLPISQARKTPGWGHKQEEEILLAKELMKTCWATYVATNTGLAPEITYFEIDDPPRMMKNVFPDLRKNPAAAKSALADLHLTSKPLYPLTNANSVWRKDVVIMPQDKHNLQRPETVESLLYMYRILEDDTYRHWGWQMFKNFVNHTSISVQDRDPPIRDPHNKNVDLEAKRRTPSSHIRAFTSLDNVDVIPAAQRDNMESFWLAETLKYFYLLFSDREFLPLEATVFNTEAHVFPRFQMGQLFKTGWKRKHGKGSWLS
ncbi:mannosyl-oligosaccharide 1,2-alpha-mannosidase [Histoplasma capsulatum var. duboisii H88]|uniref:alpha-1,2-Mannosidase n=2 Tax=Ajellomyces capsulatus (strain H88) TaxID=544711 RepID=F0UA45_AJEC8|nr:mannosyl-oligosaccharide 1,2-alpha-mannosidase [Histoplasma capsulatum var. duboisii H88]